MHLRGLVFPPPHQLLFPPVIISVAITTHYSSDQPRLWTTTNEKCQQHKQRFESQAEVVISGSHQHLTVQVTGSVLSKALGCLCMEVMQPRKTFLSLAPCQPAVGGQDALPAPLWGRQLVLQLPHPSRPLGAAGADSHPHLSASSQTPKRKGKNQPHSLPQHCLGTPRALGCRERPPGSAPCTPSPLGPAMATLYSHHSVGAMGRARAAENSSFTFSKNTVLLFPLDLISYLLTVVKYYCSSPPSQAGFPLSPRYPPLFFKSWNYGDFFFLSVGGLFTALMLQSGE